MHPNDLERKRIEHALARRKRYRYVSPRVATVPGGYQIMSPCCSRRIDPNGGIVDIARLIFAEAQRHWLLYRKDHDAGTWRLHAEYDALPALLQQINNDPGRIFWR